MAESTVLPKGRLLSIDALRGFDMFWIIGADSLMRTFFGLFDNPAAAAIAAQFTHVHWHGCHFEDTIFPLFLFIIGATLPFSISKRLARGESRSKLYKHIFVRTAIMYFLNLAYYGLFDLDFANQRYVGVLARLAFCYMFASLIVINWNVKGQAVWTAAILLLYWAAMYLIPVPGYGAGNITPEGNFAAWFDATFLPGRHNQFGAVTVGDTTGLLGIIPATASTLLGTLAAHWLKSERSESVKVRGLFAAAAVSLVAGLIWGLVFPINKHIWTSSFVLVAGSWCIFILGLFYWIIDIKGWKKWAFPFVVIGMNPLTIYLAQRFMNFRYTSTFFLKGIAGLTGSFEPVVLGAGFLALNWLFVYFLYKRRIFVKL